MSQEDNVQEGQTNTAAVNTGTEDQAQDNTSTGTNPENTNTTADSQDDNKESSGGEDGAGGGEDTTGKDGLDAEKKPQKSLWVQKRINELATEKNTAKAEAVAAKERLDEALKQLATLQSEQDPNNPNRVNVPAAEIERLANERAGQIAQQRFEQQQYRDTIDRVWAAGTTAYTDFPESVSKLQMLGEVFDNSLPILTETVTDAHKVLQHLSGDLDEAERIMSLPPLKQAAALIRLEAQLSAVVPAKQISKVPKPVTPIDGKSKAAASLDDPKLRTDEWVKLREQELRKQGKKLY